MESSGCNRELVSVITFCLSYMRCAEGEELSSHYSEIHASRTSCMFKET